MIDPFMIKIADIQSVAAAIAIRVNNAVRSYFLAIIGNNVLDLVSSTMTVNIFALVAKEG